MIEFFLRTLRAFIERKSFFLSDLESFVETQNDF